MAFSWHFCILYTRSEWPCNTSSLGIRKRPLLLEERSNNKGHLMGY